MADICGEVYTRILSGDLEPSYVLCTYVKGHRARCSWETLKLQDETEREQVIDLRHNAPQDIRLAVENIERGRWDRWLELILSTGHDRKRAKRRVPGFPRKTA